jgi:lipocalin
LRQANGTVYKTSNPGKYEVQFDETPNERGNYWIVALGDIPAEESQYPWSIVSTPFRTSLFILARDVERFRSVYAKEVFEIVRKEGFTFNYNRPLETYQGNDCLYPDSLPPPSISNEEPNQCV